MLDLLTSAAAFLRGEIEVLSSKVLSLSLGVARLYIWMLVSSYSRDLDLLELTLFRYMSAYFW